MSGEKNAIELQLQVRRNATEYQNSVKDLYSWEKDIKNREEAMKNAPAPTVDRKTLPVRSHVTKSSEPTKKTTSQPAQSPSSTASTPTEKQDLPQDALAQQHKKANDIKDRGNNYVKQADYERAIEAYTEAVEVYPYDAIYFINRALCHLKLERYGNCVDDCESAIALDKTCVKAYYRRMQANESLGNNMEALKDCTTVLTLDPKNIEAKRSLERINDRLRKNATKNGPNFSAPNDNLIDILPFDKPAYKRSKQSMRRVPVVDIVTPRANQQQPQQLRITDDEIDKIFNSNCGPFTEVKKDPAQKTTAKPEKIVEIEQQPQQTSTIQSKVIEKSTTISEKVVKTVSQEPAKSKVVDIQTGEKTNLKAVKEEVNANNTEKTINKAETAKIKSKPEPEAKQSSSTAMERIPAAPAGTAQFYVTWKELSAVQKYHYLKSIEIPNLCKILGASFDSDTFSDLMETLHEFYVPNKEPTTAAVLWEISKNDEFTILAMLMSKEEKKLVTSIMAAIKEFPKSNAELLVKLAKVYSVA
ncbi:RNA polymerase II-associated protein 3 [Drosophila sulfurigaster albostrigata]|uniref:RNA polymerase II-associated protein 3 n=1 Tax=Drosophila sulfurigaster albostrigata TaxID=89887 RepID=UPI002D21B179|nr:RNA polymerase II-associated protein 3 [Drosophila sulfurigaster albostrigata]